MKHAAALSLLTVAVAFAGCGGGGDDKGASTTPATSGGTLTKPQYIAAAEQICKATADKIAAAAEPLRASAEKTGTLPVSKVSSFLAKTTLPAYDAMLDELRTLKPPKQDEKTIDGYIAALAGAVDTAKSDPRKYSKNNQRDPFDDANKRAIDYGMKVCGS